ncbi:Hypothetical_protein [Hexamita inflata]|uniref:Hypothetical_protein n=1 Tax=Hexamita inflata TaxID=28002 RepID=A0ABP1HJ42_9EUKA
MRTAVLAAGTSRPAEEKAKNDLFPPKRKGEAGAVLSQQNRYKEHLVLGSAGTTQHKENQRLQIAVELQQLEKEKMDQKQIEMENKIQYLQMKQVETKEQHHLEMQFVNK